MKQIIPTTITTAPGGGCPAPFVTVTPRFGARLVQEGNQLHYLADRAGIRGRFSDADAYHLDQAFPLLMKQLELMFTSGELNPRHQQTVTLYAKRMIGESPSVRTGTFASDEKARTALCHTDRHNNTGAGHKPRYAGCHTTVTYREKTRPQLISFYSQNNRR